MKLMLLESTPNPEKVVACAAKLCYSSSTVLDLIDISDDKVESFIERFMNLGHESPLEHISFTFAVEGISRACSHQLVRHRIASYSQQSQRYVNLEKTFEYITPPSISKVKCINDTYNKALNLAFENYVKVSRDLLIYKIYDYLVEEKQLYSPDICQNEEFMIESMKSTSKKLYNQFEKEAIEDARYILPNACETKLVFTMNARSIINFLSLRECNRAQWEIRELAELMRDIVVEKAPLIFKNSGASCRRGKCPEGNMCCGNPKK